MEDQRRFELLSIYDVGNSGKNKRFVNFEHLVRARGLNCVIELNGVKLTRWQLEGLRDYIRSNEGYRLLYREIDEYGAIFVNSYEESDISL